MTDEVFERYVSKYSDMVYRIAFHYLKCKEDAEDVYQDVFLKLYRNRKNHRDEEHVKRWLIRVTMNECHSLWRLPWKQKRAVVDDVDKTIELQQSQNMLERDSVNEYEESVREMLSGIPTKYGIVLYLHYFEEYSTKEIAGILKRKESTVRSQLKRGRDILRKMMENAQEQGIVHK